MYQLQGGNQGLERKLLQGSEDRLGYVRQLGAIQSAPPKRRQSQQINPRKRLRNIVVREIQNNDVWFSRSCSMIFMTSLSVQSGLGKC